MGRRWEVDVLAVILALLVTGAVVGFLARWIVPGPDDIGPARTVAIGLLGSLVGGLLAFWIFGADSSAGDDWVAALLGALTLTVILLMADNWLTGRKDQITT